MSIRKLAAAAMVTFALAGCGSSQTPEDAFVAEVRETYAKEIAQEPTSDGEILRGGVFQCEEVRKFGYEIVMGGPGDTKFIEIAVRNLCPEEMPK